VEHEQRTYNNLGIAEDILSGVIHLSWCVSLALRVSISYNFGETNMLTCMVMVCLT